MVLLQCALREDGKETNGQSCDIRLQASVKLLKREWPLRSLSNSERSMSLPYVVVSSNHQDKWGSYKNIHQVPCAEIKTIERHLGSVGFVGIRGIQYTGVQQPIQRPLVHQYLRMPGDSKLSTLPIMHLSYARFGDILLTLSQPLRS